MSKITSEEGVGEGYKAMSMFDDGSCLSSEKTVPEKKIAVEEDVQRRVWKREGYI